jgi:peptidyl-prolyl cis-trans isomerase A (cyclophilin A)
MRCALFEKEAPTAVAAFIGLAESGREPWNSFTKENVREGPPFYDGTRLYSVPAGIRGGVRAARYDFEEEVPEFFIPQVERELHFDRAGRLALRGKKGLFGAQFVVLDHANAEDDGENAAIFGQCDEASIAVVTAISHRLATADNHPDIPVAINRVVIVRDGKALPPVARDVPADSVTPKVFDQPRSSMPAPEASGPLTIIETTMGQLSCRLFTKESPIATGVFMGLADGTKEWTNPVTKKVEHGTRFYDGMEFDRVIPDFVIQTGDYTDDISGGTDIGFRFKNETYPGLNYDRPGRLAFGNNGPDTNNSEIFISEHPMRRLDGGFTIIGQCDDASVRLVEAIARVPRDAANKPIKPVRIVRISFVSR